MTETFVETMNLPGAMVHVDPRLEAVLAINLLDHDPEPTRGRVPPQPERRMAPTTAEPMLVPSR